MTNSTKDTSKSSKDSSKDSSKTSSKDPRRRQFLDRLTKREEEPSVAANQSDRPPQRVELTDKTGNAVLAPAEVQFPSASSSTTACSSQLLLWKCCVTQQQPA